jgi:hypothetical protein
MTKDFEYYITKLAWDDPAFEQALSKDPVKALRDKNITVPEGIKLRVLVQKKNTMYFVIPPAKKVNEPDQIDDPEMMDVWSSGDFFIWLAPVTMKFNLHMMRSSAPEMEI